MKEKISALIYNARDLLLKLEELRKDVKSLTDLQKQNIKRRLSDISASIDTLEEMVKELKGKGKSPTLKASADGSGSKKEKVKIKNDGI